jgi:biopolymer transport protein ExbD
VTLAGLGKALDNQFHGDKEQRIYLQADKVVEYGEIMSVMNILRNAGYLKVALVGLEGRAEGQTPQ